MRISHVLPALTFMLLLTKSYGQLTPQYLERYRTYGRNDSLITVLRAAYFANESKYVCKEHDGIQARIVTPETFDTSLRPIINNLFIGSNDLVSNATAASFVQNTDKGTLNLSYAWMAKKKVWSIGAFAKSTDGIFGIYSSGSWSTEMGLNASFSFPLSATRFFNEKDCEKLTQKRQPFVRKYMHDMLDISGYNAAALKSRSAQIQQLVKNLNDAADPASNPDYYNDLITEKAQVDSILKRYDSLFTKYPVVGGVAGLQDSLEKHLEHITSVWEQSQLSQFTGYKLSWLELTGSFSNNALALNTDSLTTVQKEGYKQLNVGKFSFGLSWNLQRNTFRTLQHFNVGIAIARHNFLDHPAYSKPEARFNSMTGSYDVWNKNTQPIGPYEALTYPIMTWEPAANYYFFFASAKQFGIGLRADTRLPFSLPDPISRAMYPSTFNLMAGPVFRFNASDAISKGTVGLDLGIVDCPYDTHVWTSFGFRFKVGVPFNALIK